MAKFHLLIIAIAWMLLLILGGLLLIISFNTWFPLVAGAAILLAIFSTGYYERKFKYR